MCSLFKKWGCSLKQNCVYVIEAAEIQRRKVEREQRAIDDMRFNTQNLLDFPETCKNSKKKELLVENGELTYVCDTYYKYSRC